MADPAPVQLRESGVGVVVGGIVLVVMAWVSTPALGATATTVFGLLAMLWGPEVVDRRRFSVGIVLVGGIGMVETSRFGIGFDPLVIGTFAMAFGMFDILFGLIFGRMRRQREDET